MKRPARHSGRSQVGFRAWLVSEALAKTNRVSGFEKFPSPTKEQLAAIATVEESFSRGKR